MKIAIVQPRVSYYNGGGEIFPMHFMRELTQRTDVKIDLYTLKAPIHETPLYIRFKKVALPKIHVYEYQIPQNFRYLYNTEPGENRYRWEVESLYFNSLIFSDILKNHDDLLWSYYNYDCAIHPINIPAVLNLLGYPLLSTPNDKALIDQFTATVSISKNVASKWEERMGSKLKNNFIAPPVISMPKDPVVNTQLFSGPGPHIVFAGRLIQRKGLITLVNAVLLLKKKNPNIKVYILGEGPFKENLIKHITKLHLQSRIIFLGYKENISDYFLNADICVFPSIGGEGLMGTVLEAMYCGGFVITTTGNGNEEILQDHKEGLIIQPNNELILAQSIQFVITHSEWARHIRINAKNKARQNFTWDKYIQKIKTIIQDTVKLT